MNMVKGIVTTWIPGAKVNFDSLLYRFDDLRGLSQRFWGEVIRSRWTLRDTDNLGLCVRPDWNERPWEYFKLHESLPDFVRPGDEVVGLMARSRNGEDENCLGVVRRLETVNGVSPTLNSERVNWLLQPMEHRRMIGHTPFEGPITRFLTCVHCCPGTGDRFPIIATDMSGKTVFLRKFLQEVREEAELIVILGERPEEALKVIYLQFEAKLFWATAEKSPLLRLCTIETGLQYAQRQAEIGKDVVVLIDSITTLAGEALNNLMVPPGMGISTGNVNPLTREFITLFMSVGGRYEKGSITFLGTVLDKLDNRSVDLIGDCRSISTGVITLDSNITNILKSRVEKRGRRKFSFQEFYDLTDYCPPIDPGVREVRSRTGQALWRSSFAREQAQWVSHLEEASQRIAEEVSPANQLYVLKRADESAGRRADWKLQEGRATRRAIDKLELLARLARESKNAEEVVQRFLGDKAPPIQVPVGPPNQKENGGDGSRIPSSQRATQNSSRRRS